MLIIISQPFFARFFSLGPVAVLGWWDHAPTWHGGTSRRPRLVGPCTDLARGDQSPPSAGGTVHRPCTGRTSRCPRLAVQALPPTRSSLRQEIILPRLDSSSLYSASSVRDKQRAPRATYSAGIVLREQHISRTAGGASIGRLAHRVPRAACLTRRVLRERRAPRATCSESSVLRERRAP